MNSKCLYQIILLINQKSAKDPIVFLVWKIIIKKKLNEKTPSKILFLVHQ